MNKAKAMVRLKAKLAAVLEATTFARREEIRWVVKAEFGSQIRNQVTTHQSCEGCAIWIKEADTESVLKEF